MNRLSRDYKKQFCYYSHLCLICFLWQNMNIVHQSDNYRCLIVYFLYDEWRTYRIVYKNADLLCFGKTQQIKKIVFEHQNTSQFTQSVCISS